MCEHRSAAHVHSATSPAHRTRTFCALTSADTLGRQRAGPRRNSVTPTNPNPDTQHHAPRRCSVILNRTSPHETGCPVCDAKVRSHRSTSRDGVKEQSETPHAADRFPTIAARKTDNL